MDDDILKKNVDLIIKIQSLWRGHTARKLANVFKINQRGGSRYFTAEEAMETVTKGKAYDPNS
jgi:hypothetical protein